MIWYWHFAHIMVALLNIVPPGTTSLEPTLAACSAEMPGLLL
jgi:hypothetical protein